MGKTIPLSLLLFALWARLGHCPRSPGPAQLTSSIQAAIKQFLISAEDWHRTGKDGPAEKLTATLIFSKGVFFILAVGVLYIRYTS